MPTVWMVSEVTDIEVHILSLYASLELNGIHKDVHLQLQDHEIKATVDAYTDM